MKKVCLLTSSRADWGILIPLCRKLEAHDEIDFSILGFGSHSEDPYRSYFLADLESFSKKHLIETKRQGGSSLEACLLLGQQSSPIAKKLKEFSPDIVLCLGDRYEMLGAVTIASIMGIPVAHLHGGEVSEGAMDDNFRHAISKLSHIHFPATEKSKVRLMRMGESPEFVFNVGSLGVENVLNLELIDSKEILDELGLSGEKPILLGTFHPETRSNMSGEEQIQIIINGLKPFLDGFDVVFTGTNTDPEGDSINQILKKFAEDNEQVHLFGNLGVKKYLSCLRDCALVFGNSSSGIIEGPSFQKPIVDIGTRQKGRERSEWVSHCDLNSKNIEDTIKAALNRKERGFSNPYEGKKTSETILEKLLNIDLNEIQFKKFYEKES